jgi:hypothetical protein
MMRSKAAPMRRRVLGIAGRFSLRVREVQGLFHD